MKNGSLKKLDFMYLIWYSLSMDIEPILTINFFLTSFGKEPVRELLKEMDREDRKIIGEDIKLLQFRWPLGMPLVRKMCANLWEIRSKLKNGSQFRVFFTVKNDLNSGDQIRLQKRTGFVLLYLCHTPQK